MLENVPLLAQVPIEPGWTDYLLNQGVIGFVCAILLYFLIKKDTQVENISEKRLVDLKSVTEIIKNQTVALEAMTKADDEIHLALANQIRLGDKQVLIIEQLSKELADLKSEIKTICGGIK